VIGFTVIGGYLGAGKTTLLNHLLANVEGRRLGVLVNDFGAINIDADLIESQQETTISLANGCICCSIADGFVEAIDYLQGLDNPPEHIVVEASGVAEVNQLAQYGYLPGLSLEGVLVVVDAETMFEKVNDRYAGATIRRQIEAADLVLLNKTDLLGDGHLEVCLNWLASTFPGIRVVPAVRATVPLSLMLGRYDHDEVFRPENAIHPQYESWHVTLDQSVDRERLEAFAAALHPQVIRAKGTSGRDGRDGLSLQVVGRRKEVTVIKHAPPGTRLIAIGLRGQLDSRVLDELAERLL